MNAKFHRVPKSGVTYVDARVFYPSDDPPETIVIDDVVYMRTVLDAGPSFFDEEGLNADL